jgi:hypothetical protein
MKRYLALFSLVLLLTSPPAINSCVAQTPASPPPTVKLSDLSFITGLWRADFGGGVGEEHWSAAAGDSMVGTFRFVKDDSAQFYELMLIEETPKGLVLRLKHFNPGLIGWEEKGQAHSYPLVEFHKGLAAFEQIDKKSRLTFRRTAKDALLVLLEQTRDGKQNSEEFKFKLVK